MRICLLILIGVILGAGCATSPRSKAPSQLATPSDANSPGGSVFDELEAQLAQSQVSVPDPLEPVNRIIFGVNDTVYSWLKPVRQVYINTIPRPVRLGIRNFFYNLGTPVRIVNCILQGKNPEADVELQRFAINTTVGVLGFGDPARARWGLKPADEDLGQTLAVYGLGDGFYLVWPLLGPSTLRNSAGMVGDMFLYPVFYVEPEWLAISISAVSTANDMSFRLGEYDSLKAATVDPYVAVRDAYIQYRRKQIQDEALPTDANSVKP